MTLPEFLSLGGPMLVLILLTSAVAAVVCNSVRRVSRAAPIPTSRRYYGVSTAAGIGPF